VRNDPGDTDSSARQARQQPPRRGLDSASSAPLHPAARDILLAALDRGWADPRRLHHEARTARLLLDNARAVTAEALGVRDDEVTFVPSGTHAVHLGLLGLVRGSRRGDGVAHSVIEHSAVHHAVTWGARATTVGCDREGVVDTAELAAAVADHTGVVALQAANHEVGTLQHVDGLDVPGDVAVFTDACASMGRLDLPASWAAAAGSAHKWGGPAGVGVLLVRRRARWRNPFPADDRADERATGFENVPAALAAAAALQSVVAERAEVNARQHELVALVRERAAAIPDVEVVGHPDVRLPHLVTFSCLYVDGEALVHELDRRGFGVASGSACAATTLRPSHVLEAMGVLTHGNVRLSLHRDTSRDDLEAFLAALGDVVTDLRRQVGL
jgi:cysteine desulfurase